MNSRHPIAGFRRASTAGKKLIRHRPAAGSSLAGRLDHSLAFPTASVRCARPMAPLFVRCDVCRRFARLYLAEIRDTDYRTKTFSCCRCGSDGALALSEANTETGMTDYQLDQIERPQHHPAAGARLTSSPSPREALRGEGPYSLTRIFSVRMRTVTRTLESRRRITKNLADEKREVPMARGHAAPLSPNEEVSLRRVALGIAKPADLSPRDITRLKALSLIEEHGAGMRLTPLGRERYLALPNSGAIYEVSTHRTCLFPR